MDAFLWLAPLTLLLLSIKLIFYSKRSSVRLPPTPWKLPFIGNLHQLGLPPQQSLDKLAKKHGPLMLLKLGQVPTLVVSSSQMAREILKTHDLIFANRPILRAAEILLYGGLDMGFAPYGEHWRQMRKICFINLLSMKRVQSFHAAREEEVAHLIDKISEACSLPLESLNMSQVLNKFSNDMMCRAMMGKFSREEGRNKVFHKLIEETILLLCGFNLVDYFPSLGWLSSLLGLDERAKRNSSNWEAVLCQIIQERSFRKREKTKDDGFVDILLSLQKDPNLGISLTDEIIKALLLDLFAAGIDTVYIALEWSMAELIKNPQIMRKLQDEVRGIACGKLIVKEEDLTKMSYVKLVIKEVLRLHPPAPLLVPRESMDSCQIEGYDIPRKTRVIINYWSIARDPKIWDCPEKFRPERFIDNPKEFKGQDYEYIPFGSGRRVCPGMQFAVSTIELALANLVYRFDWKLLDNMVPDDVDMSESPGMTFRMKNNLYLVANSCVP